MTDQPDSAKKLRKFEDHMESQKANIERALYAAEIECPDAMKSQFCPKDKTRCEFRAESAIPELPMCYVYCIRRFIPRFNQDDVTQE